MIDYVCCADCGHMIPKESLPIHEAWSCRALPPGEAPPDLAENSQNSMDSSNSVLSDDSDGSEAIRRRRKEARYAACVAQARTVGMVEDGQEVDFSIAPYAAVTPLAPSVSKEGNVYNNNDTKCLDDYIASARAVGLIEDCKVDGIYPVKPASPPRVATFPEEEAYAAQARTVGRVEDGREVDFSIAPYAAITPPSSMNAQGSNIYNSNNNTLPQDYAVSARAAGLIEDGVTDDLTADAATSSLSSTSLKLGGIVFVWSAIGGVMSFMQGTSVVEGIVQGATTASVAGFGLAAGNAILSPA